jgi:O-acetyl-ADP-ribose deacetylase (regulator of RNase III)
VDSYFPKVAVLARDIATLAVDVIVNAANSSLRGGAGVDGAIHRAAGPELLAECATLGGCPPGEARMTGAYQLPSRWIIHTVGPVWQGGDHSEPGVLGSCYRRCLELAVEQQAQTLAFPAISCGLFGYPADEAAQVAVTTLLEFDYRQARPERVFFACTDADVLLAFSAAVKKLRVLRK